MFQCFCIFVDDDMVKWWCYKSYNGEMNYMVRFKFCSGDELIFGIYYVIQHVNYGGPEYNRATHLHYMINTYF